MAEVHRSNMSKLGIDGKPILREDGKFLKGPNYFPPSLKPIIEKLYAKETRTET
jgi:predicted HAD superfamily Cof-like phosphohydrolase